MATRIVIHQNVVNSINKTQGDKFLDDISKQVRDIAKTLVAVKSGALRDSIEVIEEANGINTVGSSLPYAMKEELRHPYLRPALQRAISIKR